MDKQELALILIILLVFLYFIYTYILLKEILYKVNEIKATLRVGKDKDGNDIPITDPVLRRRSANIYKNKMAALEKNRGK
jgi:hypothetical protein